MKWSIIVRLSQSRGSDTSIWVTPEYFNVILDPWDISVPESRLGYFDEGMKPTLQSRSLIAQSCICLLGLNHCLARGEAKY